tara:strand:+ start:2870 stop:3001 length:132 start_codon:yes stop_codon:yes gene_type:complete
LINNIINKTKSPYFSWAFLFLFISKLFYKFKSGSPRYLAINET